MYGLVLLRLDEKERKTHKHTYVIDTGEKGFKEACYNIAIPTNTLLSDYLGNVPQQRTPPGHVRTKIKPAL